MSVWLGRKQKTSNLSRTSRFHKKLVFEENFNPPKAHWKIVRGDWTPQNSSYWQTQVCGAWSGDIGNYISYFVPPKIGNNFILSMELTPHEFCPTNPNQYGIGLVAHYPEKLTLTLTNAFSKTSGRLQVGWGACVPYPIKVGKTYLMKMLVTGKTVMGKVWAKGEPEPDKWMVTDKYETKLNGKGVGIYCFNTKGEFKNFKLYKISR